MSYQLSTSIPMPHKFRTFLLFLLIAIVILGFLDPQGIRAAVTNNLWTISFLQNYSKNEDLDFQHSTPPSDHRHAGLLFANQTLKSGFLPEASKHINAPIRFPDRLVLRTRANFFYLENQYEDAILIWKDLGLWSTLQFAAADLSKNEKFDEAILASQSGYELFPERSVGNLINTMMVKAIFLYGQNQFPEAISAYQAILAQFPDSGRSYEGLAKAYLGNQQPALAIQTLEYGWNHNTGNIHFFNMAASIYEQNGMLTDALRAYQAALDIDHDNETALRGIERLSDTDE